MTKILHKRGSGEPDAGSLDVGEIALDTSAGTAYTKLSNGTVVEIGGSGGDSAGAGMVISKTEPVDKVDGMQWLEADTGLVFIWDENKWLQFPAGSEGGGSSGGSGSTLTATAKGDISDGRPTVINSDGTVSGAGEGFDWLQDAVIGARSSGQYITSAIDGYFISCPITKHNAVLVVYADSSQKVWSRMCRVENGTITWGLEYVIRSGSSLPYGVVYDEENDIAVIMYRNQTSTGGETVVYTPDPNGGLYGSIGPSLGIQASKWSFPSLVYDPVEKLYACFYRDQRTGNVGSCQLGRLDLSDGAATSKHIAWSVMNDSVTFDTVEARSNSAVYDPATGSIVNFYAETNVDGRAIVGKIANNRITFGTPVQYENHFTIPAQRITAKPNGEIPLFYRYRDGVVTDWARFRVCTVSGTTINIGDSHEVYQDWTIARNAIYDPSADAFQLLHQATNEGPCFRSARVSGGNVTFNNNTVISDTLSINTDCAMSYQEGENTFMVFGRNNDGVKDAVCGHTIVASDAAKINDENFIGFSSGAYSDGSDATISIAGSINASQSGLSPAKKYYANSDGSLTTTEGADTEYAGIAASPTSIIVKG